MTFLRLYYFVNQDSLALKMLEICTVMKIVDSHQSEIRMILEIVDSHQSEIHTILEIVKSQQ